LQRGFLLYQQKQIAASLVNFNARSFAAAAVVKENLQKDYYKILGIGNTATPH